MKLKVRGNLIKTLEEVLILFEGKSVQFFSARASLRTSDFLNPRLVNETEFLL